MVTVRSLRRDVNARRKSATALNLGLALFTTAALACAALAFACAPQPPRTIARKAPPCPSDSKLFRGAKVFDGEKGLGVRDVLVVGGRIAATDACTQPAETIDATGATLLPGLIDAHVHAGRQDGPLARSLEFGVTTVIDLFGPPKRLGHQEHAGLADVRGAGTLVTAPGGHGTEYGFPVPTLATAADAQSFVDARIAEGSDFIKLVIDTAPPAMPTLGRAESLAVVNAAHARRKLAVAHVGTRKDAEDAVASGVDVLGHLFVDAPADAALLTAIERKHVAVTPTLSLLEMECGIPTGAPLLEDTRVASRLSDVEKEVLGQRRTHDLAAPAGQERACVGRAEDTIRRLRGKVPVLAGTDAGNPGTMYGVSLHRELQLLVKAGLTPTEALAAATSAPADVYRLEDRGRIAPGRHADLLLVEGDPTHDIAATMAIRGVYQRGVLQARKP